MRAATSLVCLMCLGLTACGGDNGEEGKDPAPVLNPVSPGLTVLSLSNKRELSAFYVPQRAIQIFDGQEQLKIELPVCNCQDTCDAPSATKQVQHLSVGQVLYNRWDGSHWLPKQGQEGCYVKTHVKEGDALTARFCASARYVLGDEVSLGDEVCVEEGFTVGTEALVEHDVVVERGSETLLVTIVNDSPVAARFYGGECGKPGIKATYVGTIIGDVDIQRDNLCDDDVKTCDGADCYIDITSCEEDQQAQYEEPLAPGARTTLMWDETAFAKFAMNTTQASCVHYFNAPQGTVRLEVCGDFGCVSEPYTVGTGGGITLTID